MWRTRKTSLMPSWTSSKEGDILIFLGAGDVWRQGLKVLERLG